MAETIVVVESEKTALIATLKGYIGKVFIATGGKSNLAAKIKRLQPLNANVVICPDADALEQWSEIAAEYGYPIWPVTDGYSDLADEIIDGISDGFKSPIPQYLWDKEIEDINELINLTININDCKEHGEY